jgi:hypothetical protein
MRTFAFTPALALLLAAVPMQQRSKPESFSSETEAFKRPVQLPKEVLVLLTTDTEDFPQGSPKGLRCSDDDRSPRAPDDPGERLLCTNLSLFSAKGSDYLLIGVGSLRGAHIVPFWIFHQDSNGTSLLFKTRSDDLTVLTSRYNGYRELESTWIYQAGRRIVTERYRFNGKTYVRFSTRETHN